MNFVDMIIDKKLYKKFSLTEGTYFEHISKDYINWEVTTELNKTEVWAEEISLGQFTPITSGDIKLAGIIRLDHRLDERVRIYFKLYENDNLIDSYSFVLGADYDDSANKDYTAEGNPINVKAFNNYKVTAQVQIMPHPNEGTYFRAVRTRTGSAKYRIDGNVADDGSRYITEKG